MDLVEMNNTQPMSGELSTTGEQASPIVLKLVGFERLPDFVLIARPDEQPFQRLQSASNPDLEFLVVEPRHLQPGYNPDVNQRDVTNLALSKSEDALVLNIVTIHSPGKVTVNLRGPIIINRETMRGRQVVPDNACDFALQHPVQIEI